MENSKSGILKWTSVLRKHKSPFKWWPFEIYYNRFFIRYHLGLLVTINWANKLSTNNMVSIKRDVEDTLSWRESRNSCFSVSSLYCSYTRASCDHFPWCIIWRSWAPMRVSFFLLGKHLGIEFWLPDQLKRRGWNLPNRCFLCKEEEETNDHPFLFCSKASKLWSLIFSLFSVHWVLHSTVRGNLLGWSGVFVGKRSGGLPLYA